jgi:hypothetical protein
MTLDQATQCRSSNPLVELLPGAIISNLKIEITNLFLLPQSLHCNVDISDSMTNINIDMTREHIRYPIVAGTIDQISFTGLPLSGLSS